MEIHGQRYQISQNDVTRVVFAGDSIPTANGKRMDFMEERKRKERDVNHCDWCKFLSVCTHLSSFFFALNSVHSVQF